MWGFGMEWKLVYRGAHQRGLFALTKFVADATKPQTWANHHPLMVNIAPICDGTMLGRGILKGRCEFIIFCERERQTVKF